MVVLVAFLDLSVVFRSEEFLLLFFYLQKCDAHSCARILSGVVCKGGSKAAGKEAKPTNHPHARVWHSAFCC
uniref:Putative secreted protein n=1 Tax=Anopheles darlingi TaxID=43151 RepID=A0A2M4DRF0_ANODA